MRPRIDYPSSRAENEYLSCGPIFGVVEKKLDEFDMEAMAGFMGLEPADERAAKKPQIAREV